MAADDAIRAYCTAFEAGDDARGLKATENKLVNVD